MDMHPSISWKCVIQYQNFWRWCLPSNTLSCSNKGYGTRRWSFYGVKIMCIGLYTPLHQLFTLSLNQQYIHRDRRVQLIKLIFKSGDRTSVNLHPSSAHVLYFWAYSLYKDLCFYCIPYILFNGLVFSAILVLFNSSYFFFMTFIILLIKHLKLMLFDWIFQNLW